MVTVEYIQMTIKNFASLVNSSEVKKEEADFDETDYKETKPKLKLPNIGSCAR